MTKGLDQILSRLTELQVRAPRAARQAVKEAADETEQILKKNTPVYFILDEVHAKDDTKVTGFKGGDHGLISKDIGYGRATGWRIHFPDDGTKYQKSQGFEEKTINEATPIVKEIYATKVKEGLGL